MTILTQKIIINKKYTTFGDNNVNINKFDNKKC